MAGYFSFLGIILTVMELQPGTLIGYHLLVWIIEKGMEVSKMELARAHERIDTVSSTGVRRS